MTLNELWQALDEARAAFRSAGETATAAWDTRPAGPDQGGWTPRQVAEHVLGAELGYAGAVASALGLERPKWEVFELTSAFEAYAELDRVAGIGRSIMTQVSEDDLEKKVPSQATVLEVMSKAVSHIKEHSDQVRAITSWQLT